MARPPRAMVLAAGMGSRLGDMGRLRPKPLLPVLDRSLIRWVMTWLESHGVQEVVVNLHHLGELIREDLEPQRMIEIGCQDLQISFSDETGLLLGTGGGLRQAAPLLIAQDDPDDTPIVVANAKLLMDVDLSEVLRCHAQNAAHHGAEATMVLRPDDERIWGGGLACDSRGRLVELLGELLGERRESEGGATTMGHCMFTGVHVVTPRFLRRIPAEGEQCVIRTAYREAFREGKVGAYVEEHYWWEHSTPERYLQGVRSALEGRCRLARSAVGVAVHPSAKIASTATLIEPVYIGAGVCIEDDAVVGPYAQIGEGAVVRRRVRVQGSVLWPGAVASNSAVDTIISQ